MLSVPILKITETLLAINKPAGWLTVPPGLPRTDVIVLLNEIRKVYPEALPVHRLDQYTSGVCVFARSPDSQRGLSQTFSKRLVKKVYAFLALGQPTTPRWVRNDPLDGKSARTAFTIKRPGVQPNTFYGEAEPLTGRFHQVRRHAVLAGLPLLGEPKTQAKDLAPHVMLHALRLTLPDQDPIEAPLPESWNLK
jgi:tRNA pseudouridine32 synthase / 23S rRNA pseudouridine746 synthase